jgi:hypothetical protein
MVTHIPASSNLYISIDAHWEKTLRQSGRFSHKISRGRWEAASMLSRKKVLYVWNESIERARSRKLWSTSLLVLSSAALGGIAVALWNRQAIAKMMVAEEDATEIYHNKDASFLDSE